MTENSKPDIVKPWQWPALWFRDEKFWRDVASRTASGMVLGAIAFVFALVSGIIKTPENWLRVILTTLGFLFLFVYIGYFAQQFNPPPGSKTMSIDEAAAKVWKKRRGRRQKRGHK